VCPHTSDRAIALWGKACNFHRGSDPSHPCGNPSACKRALARAEEAEGIHLEFVREWQ
jgi:hypothetical protein